MFESRQNSEVVASRFSVEVTRRRGEHDGRLDRGRDRSRSQENKRNTDGYWVIPFCIWFSKTERNDLDSPGVQEGCMMLYGFSGLSIV